MSERRIFFALWPSRAVVEQLATVQREQKLNGKPVALDNLHITLAFIGQASPTYLECLRNAARAADFAPFRLTLQRLGFFRKPRIAWLGPEKAPAALATLHAALMGQLSECGFVPEAREFRPHVTLARKADPVEAANVEPIVWDVKDFVLAESRLSEAGPCYHILQRYPARSQQT